MARKRTKKEAKDRLPRLPTVPPVLVPSLGPLAPFYVVGKSAEMVADRLIDIDPLDRLASIVNDPSISIAPSMVEMVNDPEIMMTRAGEFVRTSSPRASTMPSGRDVIRASGQFGLQNVLPRAKRTRKKNGNDKKLSAAFKEANKRYRTKSGKLRKGRTQADIARLAQRLRKKM